MKIKLIQQKNKLCVAQDEKILLFFIVTQFCVARILRNSLGKEVVMKGRELLLLLCFVLSTKYSYPLSRSADTSGIQNDVPMNYPSRIPFSNKIGTSNVYIWPNP